MQMIKLMHFSFYTMIILLFPLISGCSNEDVKHKEIYLEKNEQQKEIVFEQILNDKQLFYDFMERMMENDQPMQWMMDHDGMMQLMFEADNMQYMMQHNDDMQDHMMDGMMHMARRDSNFMMRWKNMMEDQGGMEGRHMEGHMDDEHMGQ